MSDDIPETGEEWFKQAKLLPEACAYPFEITYRQVHQDAHHLPVLRPEVEAQPMKCRFYSSAVKGTDDMSDIEDEANAFAMELLMPTKFLLADLKQMGGIDLADDAQVTKLAKKYRVAISLMAIRIGQLLR